MSADRYTLPAELGGHECWIIGRGSEGRVQVGYDVRSQRLTTSLPSSWLTPVKPPLPPEPPVGSVVRAGEFIAERDDKMGGVVPSPIGTWFTTDDYDSVTWATLVERALPGVPVLLVPDPFAEPVQLPWRGLAKGAVSPDVLNVRPAIGGVVLAIERIGDEDNERWIWLDAETGKTVACAVWAAANQADKDTE